MVINNFKKLFLITIALLSLFSTLSYSKAINGANTNANSNNKNAKFEDLLGSKRIGEHFSKIPSPKPFDEFTPNIPTKKKCQWNIGNDDEDDKSVMCKYISSDGFIYKIDAENILGINLKLDHSNNMKKQLPFGILPSDSSFIIQNKIKVSGLKSNYSIINEQEYYNESICIYEILNSSKYMCFGFNKGHKLKSISIDEGELNY